MIRKLRTWLRLRNQMIFDEWWADTYRDTRPPRIYRQG